MTNKTYLERSLEAFIKDEYGLSKVIVDAHVTTAEGNEKNMKRLKHDMQNDMDFDLSDELLD